MKKDPFPLPAIPDDLGVVMACSYHDAQVARDRLRAARALVTADATAHAWRISATAAKVELTQRDAPSHAGDALLTLLPEGCNVALYTGPLQSCDPNAHTSVTVRLSGLHLPDAIHPLSPAAPPARATAAQLEHVRAGQPQDLARVLAVYDRALRSLEVACDPERRVPLTQIVELNHRLAIAKAYAEESAPADPEHPPIAFAASMDGPACAYASSRSPRADVLNDAQRAFVQGDLPPLLHVTNLSNNPNAPRLLLGAHINGRSTLNPIERLRLLAAFPGGNP